MNCILLHQQPEAGIQQVSFYPNEQQAYAALDDAYTAALAAVDKTDPYFNDELFQAVPPAPYAAENAEFRKNCLYSAQLIYCDDILEWFVYGDNEQTFY